MTTAGRSALASGAPFAGRVDELVSLDRAITAVRGGRSAAVLVVGEAGIGKTRLVREATARHSGTRALWASAWEPGGAPAFWHWIQILRSLASAHDPQTFLRQVGPDADELARLVPDDLRAGVKLGPPGDPKGDGARFRMFDAVAAFLRRSSEHEPLVVVLDDLHAADAGTLGLLRFIVENPPGRLALIGTTRDPQRDPVTADVVDVITALRRKMTTLPLSGLDRDDVTVMLEASVGAADAIRLTPEIYRRSAGNPLFIGELCRLLAEGRGLDERLPDTIRSVIAHRLAPLPAEPLEVLRAAAVIGEEFAVALLARICGMSPGNVLAAVDHGVRAGIVAGTRSPSTFAFAHALVREVLQEQLTLEARALMHRRVGEALETSAGTRPPLAELAHHFLAGATAADDDKAAHYAERAGHRAAEQLAYEDAARHFRLALAALDLPGSDQARRAPLLIAFGDATIRAGDLPGARDIFTEAAALARREGRADLLAEAALGLGSGLDGFEVRLFDHTQITLLEEALARLDERPSALRTWAMARLSVALTFAESHDRRLQLADAAAAMARKIDDPRALAYALAARCDAIAGPDHIDERLDAATEIVRLAVAAGDRGTELLGRRNRLIALLERGDIQDVDTEVASYDMVATALGQPLYQWYVALWRGMRALMDGRLDESRTFQEDAAAIGARARSHNAALNAEVLGWNTLLKEGRWREAGERLAHQLDLADGIYGERFWVPLVTPRAHPVEARAAVDRLAAHHFEELPRDAVWLAAMTYCADACGVVGHRAAAEQLYELIHPYSSRFAVDAIGAACYGAMSRPLGVLATVLGRRRAAEDHFDSAIGAHRGCGAVALVAETLHDLGSALDAFGETTRAETRLEEARSLYRSLGMDQRAEFVTANATSARTSPAATNVFQRDGDYWTLAYQGRTVRVADVKGLRDIATLLAHAGRELHVADLIEATDPAPDEAGERARAQLLRGAPKEAVLDARARAGYRDRLVELRDDLEEAEANADLGRAEAARAEMDAIAGELAAALGIGGRSRSQSDVGERARKAVTQRIRNSLRRLATLHPELAAHLDRSLRTGRFCSYSPERETVWLL